MLALGRLLRLSLAPTALADVAAGIVLGAGHWPGGFAPLALMAGSSCVYHGAMALNDWADRDEDARLRAERPIPSGAIRAGHALVLATSLLVCGPLLALWSAPRCALLLAAVAVTAALYDLRGRGPWRGPLLLAACRAGNLSVGLLYASPASAWRPALFLAPATYGLYVFLVSRLARLEDLDARSYAAGELRPARWLTAAATALCGIGLSASFLAAQTGAPRTVAVPLAGWSALLLACAAAIGLVRHARVLACARPQPADVRAGAGMALRRLLVASACFAAGAGSAPGLAVAAAILCGYPLSFALRRAFPPT